MKRLYLLLGLLGLSIILSIPLYALTSQVTTFDGQTNPFNISFTANQNQSFILDIPSYAYATNVSLKLKNYINDYIFNDFPYTLAWNVNIGSDAYSGIRFKVIRDNVRIVNATTYLNWCNVAFIFNDTNQSIYNTTTRISSTVFLFNNSPILEKDRNYTIACGDYTTGYNEYYTNALPVPFVNDTVILLNGGRKANFGTDPFVIYQNYFFNFVSFYTSVEANTSIFLNNQQAYNSINASFYSFNISQVNNLLLSSVPINITFHSTTSSILQVNLSASYAYGVDNCSTYTNNILNFNYYDEYTDTSLPLTNTYSLYFTSPFTQTLYGVTNNLSATRFCSPTTKNISYTFYGTNNLEASGYTTKFYTIDSYTPYNFTPILNLSMSLINTGNTSEVTFVTYNQVTNRILSDVAIQMYEIILGVPVLVDGRTTDVIGVAKFAYLANKQYTFTFSKSGYISYSFNLYPISSTSYNIYITPESIINKTMAFNLVNIYYAPNIFYNNYVQDFNITFAMPSCKFTSYGFNISYPSNSTSTTGTTSCGETFFKSINISNAQYYDSIYLKYWYTTTTEGTKYFFYTISIQSLPSALNNGTMVRNINPTYDLGLFERVLVSTIIFIFLVGISAMIGQVLLGFGLGLMVMGYLSYIGFLPVIIIAIPVIIGLILLFSRSQ